MLSVISTLGAISGRWTTESYTQKMLLHIFRNMRVKKYHICWVWSLLLLTIFSLLTNILKVFSHNPTVIEVKRKGSTRWHNGTWWLETRCLINMKVSMQSIDSYQCWFPCQDPLCCACESELPEQLPAQWSMPMGAAATSKAQYGKCKEEGFMHH